MSNKAGTKTAESVVNIASAVEEMDDSFLEPDLRHKVLAADAEDLQQKLAAVAAAKGALASVVTEKNQALTALTAKIDRVHSGVRSKFGRDSLEFAKVGGKRTSRRTRTPKVASASNGAAAPSASGAAPTQVGTITITAPVSPTSASTVH